MKKNILWKLIIGAILGLPVSLFAQTTSYDTLKANDGWDKSINWTIPGGGVGYGHQFINKNGPGFVYLYLQKRNNSSSWSNMIRFTSMGETKFYGDVGINADPDGYRFRVNGTSLFEGMAQANRMMVEGDPATGPENVSIYLHHWGVNVHRLRYNSGTLYLENFSNLPNIPWNSNGNPNLRVSGTIMLPKSRTYGGARTGIIDSENPYSEQLYDGQYLNVNGLGFHNFKDDPATGDPAGTNLYLSSFFGIDFFTGNEVDGTYKPRMRINCRGNVGIGTAHSKHSLQIGDMDAPKKVSLMMVGPDSDTESSFIGFQEGSNTQLYYKFKVNTLDNYLHLSSQEVNHIIAFNRQNGNVGIGMPLLSSNNPNNYKLAVNGTIGAKEVMVENTSTTWPDYVFEENYEVKDLEEVESYIKTEKHLPEVPSAQEISQNGHSLGEMDAILLRKIEELTLYLIEQNKKLENQEDLIIELKNEIKELKQ